MSDESALAAVTAANQAFYDAHEARDLGAMTAVWLHDDSATCVHPGWPFLRGWTAIEASWRAIFQGPGRNQFILTDVVATVGQDIAWVTLEENLVDQGSLAPITATNVFRLVDGEWRLVVHHAGPVLAQTAGE
ncbi:MAG: nuclear transport factor 2 family protein [Actinomycetota bacterium]